MGVRSDVGIALRADVQLTSEAFNFLAKHADETHERPEGTLYVCQSIKWHEWRYGEINDFMAFLKGLADEQYLLVEACGEYPDPEAPPAGKWLDNPFDLRQEITINLCYS